MLTAIVHILDRSQVDGSKLVQCQRLCSTFNNQKSVSDSYKSTLLKSIETLCSPVDIYTACIHHIMKFDISENFV